MHLYHLTDELLEALVASRLRSFIVPTCSAGEWWGPCGGESHITRPAYERGLALCNRLLDRMDVEGTRVACELNGDIVPRAQFAERTLRADDALEIVRFVGGG